MTDVRFAGSGAFTSPTASLVMVPSTGSGLEFEDRGIAELKGVPGEWRLYAVAA